MVGNDRGKICGRQLQNTYLCIIMRKLYLFLCLACLVFSCNVKTEPVTAGGNPYTVFLIAENTVITSPVGDTIKAMFSENVEWISQPEPIYDLFCLTPATLSPVVKNSRNLIFVDIAEKYDSTEIQMVNDEFIPGQLCFHITSPSAEDAADYVWRYHDLMVRVVDKTERDRFIKKLGIYDNPTLHEMVRDSFGFDMCIPSDFRVRNAKEDFIWISKEMPESSQGIVVYRFDGASADSMWIVSERNKAVGKIPGPSDGSRMSTFTDFFPETRVITIGGRKWWETRGYWNVIGDFMGGPFVNYVTEYDGGFIGIDLYVYSPSPRYPQRNYIRQLEAIPLTVSMEN